jgi:enoyl-CoA hydratase/carnithine racemase
MLPEIEKAKCVLLYGVGPSFCAGSDLKELAKTDLTGMLAHEERTAAMVRRLGLLSTPVVASVQGHALGGGFILAASCDFVVTAEDSTWSLPEVPNGWLPPWGLAALVARVGPVRAKRLTWGIEKLDGHDAKRLGVADFCVPDGSALPEARRVAARLAALPDAARRATKLFFQPGLMSQSEAWDAEASRIFAANCETREAKTTLSKFMPKL